MAAATAPQPCSPSNFTRATMSRDSCYCTRIMANTRRCWRALKHRAEKKSLRSTLIWKTRRKKLAKWLSRCARPRLCRDDSRAAAAQCMAASGIAPHELAARTDTHIRLTDHGCMLRGYSRRIVNRMNAYGETNIFIPALGYTFAQNPAEIEVAHDKR